MKILLINPPNEFKTPILPLGLASIAAYLKSNNINVQVLDAWAEQISLGELKNRVLQSKADIIGIYMLSPYYDKTKNIIEISRQALPNSIIVVGGCHPSAMPIETLKEIPQLDICAIGEGEITMYELVKSFQEKSELSAVDGIAFRDKSSGEIIVTKPRDFIKNLDELPFPARELFPLQKYRTHPPYGRKNPYFTMVTSRGCPFQCAFCSKEVFRENFRAVSPKRVVDEIEELVAKYHAQEIHFYEDDFSLDMRRAEEICDEILRRGIKIIWSCGTRVNLVNEKLLRKMKQAGCWLVAYGVESGNQKILDAIDKRISIDQIVSAFEMTKKVGLSTVCYLIIGLPGETKETIQETINLVKKIKPDFIASAVAIVYPGSRFFKSILEGKYPGRLRNLDDGKNLAGTFAGKGNLVVFESNLTLEELKAAVKKANREFYLRPRYIIQSLKKIRSLSDLNYYLCGGIEVIKSVIN